mgnify:CR=1 FL=1
MVQIREFNVSDTDEIVRLDKFLAVNMPEFSRSEIQKFNITRPDGKTVKLSEKVRGGWRAGIREFCSHSGIGRLCEDCGA